MTRLWREGLPIEIQRRAAGDDPARIRLQGKLLDIDRIWQHIEVQSDWWTDVGGVDREVFTVTTREPAMLITLYQDRRRGGKWFVERIYD